MKYFIISTLFTSLLIFYSCDVKTSSPPAENKSKNSSVISIKPKLARHFATVDSTVIFNNLSILLRISQRVVPEEATKVILKNDTIYCNQSYLDITVYIDKKNFISERFDKPTYEWLVDEPLDSVVWGHKGIDSVTSSGIFITTILYKPSTKKYYNIQFVCDLSGRRTISHIYDNIVGKNDSIFAYELNRQKIKIHQNYPDYYLYQYSYDDSSRTYFDSILVVDNKKQKIQNISFKGTIAEENYSKLPDIGEPAFDFLDLNFDDYLDLRFYSSPGSRNDYYDYWLFNPKTKKYIYNSKLSNIANLEVDTVKKQLNSLRYSGSNEYDSEAYKYINNVPVVVEKENVYAVYEKSVNENIPNYFIKEIYKRKNGKLVLISKKRMSNDESYDN
jgi:hypothetical protein